MRGATFSLFAPVARAVVLILALGALVIALWVAVARNLDLPWTSIRLAPAFAFARGLPLFTMPDQPPWVMVGYGPLYPLAYLPAVWARHPAPAVVTATLLAQFCVLAPVGLLCSLLRHRNAAPAGEHRAPWLAMALAFALISHLVPSLAYATAGVHADAPAFGLLLLACYAVLRAGRAKESRMRRWLLGAGVAVGLSAACKLNFAAGILALLVWVLRFHGWKRGAEFFAASVVAVMVGYGWEGLRDGFTPLFLNLTLTGPMPWFTFSDTETMALSGISPEFSDKLRTFLAFGRDYVKVYGPLALAIAVLGAVRGKSEDEAANLRIVWLFFFLALFLTPISIASVAKYGGDVNSCALVSLPLALAALFALASVARAGHAVARYAIYAALAGASFMIALPARDHRAKLWPKTTPTMVEAYEVISADPTRWYFPYDPLAHLLADGKFRPNIDVVYTYAVTGHPVDEAAFRSVLPEELRYLALPPSGTEWGVTELNRLLPEYNQPAPGLTFERHSVYTR
ncbi:MAG: hypothetical protein ABIR71_04115 [Chthoniobacterales bacterium]